MLYLFVLIPIIISCLLLFFPQKFVRWTILFVYIGMLAYSVYLFIRTRFFDETIIVTTGGEGILGITLYCDLITAIFLTLISFLFLLYYFYSAIRDRTLERFNFFLTILQSLLVLIVLSRDLFNIFVAIEVSTIVCSILIMFKKESRSIYDGLVYLLTNTIGMLFFLLGVGLIYRQFGVLDISEIIAMMSQAQPRELILPFAFIMTGVCLKCAIFPLHVWLPHAHGTPGAPTVVSAILSGLYVKSGIYLFIRMRAMFLPAIDLDILFLTIGVVTALMGIIMAINQKDIKLILAYHTISQIGLIMFGLSLGNDFGRAGAMLHIINHAIFKSLLFLAAGILIDNYKTRNVKDIRGVLKTYPIVGFAIIAGILGITGAPLFNGSISKYFILSGAEAFWLEIIFIVINFGTVLSFVKFGQVLLGEKRSNYKANDNYSNGVLIILGAVCLLTGVLGSPFIQLLFNQRFPINIIDYMIKVGIWSMSFILSYLVYKYFISKLKLNEKLFDVTFNTMGMFVAGFFVVLYLTAIITV